MGRLYGHNDRMREAFRPDERQRRLLDVLEASRSSAQVAERLGVTAAEAERRVGLLLSESGFGDRQALARWWRSQGHAAPSRHRTRGYRAPGALAALAVVLLIAAALSRGGTADSEEAATRAQARNPLVAGTLITNFTLPATCYSRRFVVRPLVAVEELAVISTGSAC
jgi:hypothetical protein